MNSKSRIRTILTISSILFACFISSLVYAQDKPTANPQLRAVTEDDTAQAEFSSGWASGLPVVGVNTTVYLQGSGQDAAGGDAASYSWSISGPRFTASANVQNVTFRPPMEGIYKAMLTVTDATGTSSDPSTLEITAAKWVGIQNCASCHSGGFEGLDDKVTTWKETGHASMLKENLDHGSSHYSESCINCHTVGYDVDAVNGGFDDLAAAEGWIFPATIQVGNYAELQNDFPQVANLANIQCENCHGPGSLHYGDPERIAVSVDSNVCGRCHDAPTHHIKNYEWDTSQHAIATSYPSGPGHEGCVECHTGIGFVETHDDNYDSENVSTEYAPITCAACHDPHSKENPHQVRVMDDVTLGNGVVVKAENAGMGILCMNCHKSRRNVNEYVTEYHSHYGPHHGPQAEVIKGTGGYEYPGVTYVDYSPHLAAVEDTCVSCHMAAAPSDAPMRAVGGHTFRLHAAADSIEGVTEELSNLNACTSCHDNLTTLNRMAAGDYDGDGTVEGIQDEVGALLDMVGMMLPPMDSPEVEVSEEYTAAQLKAAYNHALVSEDKSMGIHNPKYEVQLLQSSYHDLAGMDVPSADLLITWPAAVEPTPEPTMPPEPVDGAPTAEIALRGVTEQDLMDEGITSGRATGLSVVPVGGTVYLLGTGTDIAGAAVDDYAWTITGPRMNASFNIQNVTFRPPTEGTYTASLVVMDATGLLSAEDTLAITSARYEGLRNCASCHGGTFPAIADKVTGWQKTGHATMLAENLDMGSDHYTEACIECHTVGYDLEAVNGGFDDVASAAGWVFPASKVEGNWAELQTDYPEVANLSNIQCESCHGPGSQHYGDITKIGESLGANVCGYCHDALTHHTKNYEWDTSLHANATDYASGPGREGCVKCHTGIGFVETYDPDYDSENVSTEYSPISCAACHDPHNADNEHQIRVMDDVTLGNGVVVSAQEAGMGALCMNCHQSRRNVNEYVTEYHSHYGPHHGPQADVVKGTGGYEYPGVVYSTFSPHIGPILQNSCVACHMAMPSEGTPAGVVGQHTFRMHAAAGSVEGATEDVSNMNACTTCHAGLETLNRPANGDYDGDGTTEGIQDEVQGLMALVGTMLPPLDVPDVEITEEYTAEQLKAGYNYMLVSEDKSMGVHNPRYLVQLLQSSYHALAGEDVPNAMITIVWPDVIPTPTPNVVPIPTMTPTPTATPAPPVSESPVIVTDDASSTEDLSNGVDQDAADSRVLAIQWNMPNLTDVKNFHIYVSVDGAQPVYLAHPNSATATSWEWKAGPQGFKNVLFLDGPQFGKSYSFLVFVITESGSPRVLGPFANAGPVQFESE